MCERRDVFDCIGLFYTPMRQPVTDGMLLPVEFERHQRMTQQGAQKPCGGSFVRRRGGVPDNPFRRQA
jgi:hypothetical protein